MNIAAIGSKERLSELSSVLSLNSLSFSVFENSENINNQQFDVVFHLNFDENIESLNHFKHFDSNVCLFLNTVNTQLESINFSGINAKVAGINALPTFINRSTLEYCTLNSDFNHDIITQLGWTKKQLIKSRVGMITPRVICMIINEAFYTLQEGTANRNDIDLGMKLGTAYPYGPFEWADKIGIKNVYHTLEAMWNDTKDERYKICSLLKTEYLKNK